MIDSKVMLCSFFCIDQTNALKFVSSTIWTNMKMLEWWVKVHMEWWWNVDIVKLDKWWPSKSFWSWGGIFHWYRPFCCHLFMCCAITQTCLDIIFSNLTQGQGTTTYMCMSFCFVIQPKMAASRPFRFNFFLVLCHYTVMPWWNFFKLDKMTG